MKIESVICILTIENFDSHASITTARYDMKKKTSEKRWNCVQLFAAFVSHSAHLSLIASFEDNFCTFVALLPHFRCTFWGDDHRNRWPFIQHTCVLSNCKVEVATKRESEILWASEFGRNDDVDQFWSRPLAKLCWRGFLSSACSFLIDWLQHQQGTGF